MIKHLHLKGDLVEEFSGIPFVINGESEDFRPSTKRENPPRGNEYWLYMRTVNVLAHLFWSKAGNPITFGSIDSRFLEDRFLGKNYHLMREQGGIEGFPDFAVVKDDLIVAFDHFKIDPSTLLGTAENSHGTEYLRMLGIRKKEGLAIDADSMKAALAQEGIKLTIDNLAKNLGAKFNEKIAKFDSYESAIRDHIKSGHNEAFVEEDLAKPIETWLMIEEVSPTSGFVQIAETISMLLEQHPPARGLVYISNPDPTEMFSASDQVAIIANDKQAVADLRKLHQSHVG